jgi:transcription elongation factor GreA
MAAKPIYLTREKYQKYEGELQYLRDVRRREVAAKFHEVVEEGGEFETTAAYESVISEQAFLEGRIQAITDILSRASVVEARDPDGMVKIGSRVIVQEDGTDPEIFAIVGSTEADSGRGLISWESPLGQALLDHQSGDRVLVRTPGGTLHFTILQVD